jgi:hypothetical protein
MIQSSKVIRTREVKSVRRSRMGRMVGGVFQPPSGGDKYYEHASKVKRRRLWRSYFVGKYGKSWKCIRIGDVRGCAVFKVKVVR